MLGVGRERRMPPPDFQFEQLRHAHQMLCPFIGEPFRSAHVEARNTPQLRKRSHGVIGDSACFRL